MISVKRQIEQYLLTSLNNNIFSGAAVGCSTLKKRCDFKRILTYIGFTENEEKKYVVDKNILFDLASLTKPLATVLCTLNLINEGVVNWQEKLSSLLSRKVDEQKAEITLFHLLSHCSGLPAYRPYYQQIKDGYYEQGKKKIVESILAEPLVADPGQKSIYSDLGYILLGQIIETKSGQKINEFWQRIIGDSFHLSNKICYLKNNDLGPERCVATTINPVTLKPVCGIVNDDNCRIMGGVAGHAGLFGTLEGVVSICEKLIEQSKEISTCTAYSNELLKKTFKKRPLSTWTCGFDTPSIRDSLAGQYFSEKSVGHLGFTGTSFWIDLEKSIVVVVLTNRVYMKTPNERMNTFRKNIHNIIMKGLKKAS